MRGALIETGRVAFAQFLEDLFKGSNLSETCSKEVRDSIFNLYIQGEVFGMNAYHYGFYKKEIKINGKDDYLCYLSIKIEIGHGQKMDSIGKGKMAFTTGSVTTTIGSIEYMGNLVFSGFLGEIIISDKKIEGVKGRLVNHKGYSGDKVYFNEVSKLQPSSYKEHGIKRHHKVYAQRIG